ncbi:hypothetical protein REPUB_Repub10bG0112500 [Reevesia pubescens]
MHTIARNSSEAPQFDGRTFERVKDEGKQHAAEEGSSTQAEEDVKGRSMNLRANAASDRPTAEGLTLDFSAIKPGIAADLKFGGSGSYPNLPWVSTTEFVRHASEECTNPDNNNGLATFPSTNPAASAQSWSRKIYLQCHNTL